MSDIDKINEAGMRYAEKKHNHDFSTFYTPQIYASANDFMEGAVWYRDNVINFHNEGVQACIEVVKQRLTNGEGTIAGMISSIGNRIISELEQLKKP